MSTNTYPGCYDNSLCYSIDELLVESRIVHRELIRLIASGTPNERIEIMLIMNLENMLYIINDINDCEGYFLCSGPEELVRIREGLATTLKTLRFIFSNDACQEDFSRNLQRVLTIYCRDVESTLHLLQSTCIDDDSVLCEHSLRPQTYDKPIPKELCNALLISRGRAENARIILENIVAGIEIGVSKEIPPELCSILVNDYYHVNDITQYVLSQLKKDCTDCPLIFVEKDLITANRFSKFMSDLFRYCYAADDSCTFLEDVSALLILAFAIESDVIKSFRALGCDCIRDSKSCGGR